MADKILALVSLMIADVILGIRGFPTLYRVIRSWPTRGMNSGCQQAIRMTCSAVDWASMVYFKKPLCFQRAAVTTCLLRMRGIPAQLVIGCRMFPFTAHAWSEVEGKILGDNPNLHSLYSVLERF